ncbi:MAG: GNAT family N-acetyltransferase [Oscillospiraceae bacterium]
MKIIEYFSDKNQNHWKKEISKSDWGAAGFLIELLNDNEKLIRSLGEGAKLFLLTEGDALLSFVSLSRKDCINDESLYPWIGFVYTFPEHRGNRYSEKLIGFAEEQANNDGHSKVYICTDHEHLYEKFGYSYMESRIDCWGELSRVYYKNLCGGNI